MHSGDFLNLLELSEGRFFRGKLGPKVRLFVSVKMFDIVGDDRTPSVAVGLGFLNDNVE